MILNSKVLCCPIYFHNYESSLCDLTGSTGKRLPQDNQELSNRFHVAGNKSLSENSVRMNYDTLHLVSRKENLNDMNPFSIFFSSVAFWWRKKEKENKRKTQSNWVLIILPGEVTISLHIKLVHLEQGLSCVLVWVVLTYYKLIYVTILWRIYSQKNNNKKIVKSGIIYIFLISLISDLTSAARFSYMHSVVIYYFGWSIQTGNLASHRFIIGKGKSICLLK